MANQQEQPDTSVASVREGSRWRYTRPSSGEVNAWFDTQKLDEDMKHEDYVSGVVLIAASEKVKITSQRPDGKKVTEEVYEQTFTPYVRIDMRVLYFRRLAESLDLIRVIEPATDRVPKIADAQSAYFNGNLGDGLWWHVVNDSQGKTVRFLVSTHRVALYEKQAWMDSADDAERRKLSPVLEGVGSKQVNGGPDENAIMKAETGAIGRALGVAGILVVGTGIATAEDMIEALSGRQALGSAEIPEGGPRGPETGPTDPQEVLKQLRETAVGLEAAIKAESDTAWRDFAAWWKERSSAEGWRALGDVPVDPMRGIVSKMERMLDQAKREPGEERVEDTSPANES